MAQIYTAGDRRGPRTHGRSPEPVSEVLTDVQKKRELRAKLEERGLAQAKPRPAESLKPDRQPRYVAAIDQGTTSTRFMVFDYAGQVMAFLDREHAGPLASEEAWDAMQLHVVSALETIQALP